MGIAYAFPAFYVAFLVGEFPSTVPDNMNLEYGIMIL